VRKIRSPRVRRFGVDAIQYSAATGDAGYGSGSGPGGAQRLIFGFTGRKDYIDSKGGRPGAPGVQSFVTRLGFGGDTRVLDPGGFPGAACTSAAPKMKRFIDTEFMPPSFGLTSLPRPVITMFGWHWADTPETPWVEREGKGTRSPGQPLSIINGKR